MRELLRKHGVRLRGGEEEQQRGQNQRQAVHRSVRAQRFPLDRPF